MARAKPPQPLTAEQQLLVTKNLGLVCSVMGKFPIHPNDRDDVEQAGRFALMRSARLFDPDRGFKFSTYVFRAVRHAIVGEWQRRQKQTNHLVYVDTGDLDRRNSDAAPADDVERAETLTVLQRRLRQLNPRSQQILRRRFGIGCEAETLDEVGRDLGITRERVRQIQARAIEQLQRLMAAS